MTCIKMLHNLCQICLRNMCKVAWSCSVAEVERRGDRQVERASIFELGLVAKIYS